MRVKYALEIGGRYFVGTNRIYSPAKPGEWRAMTDSITCTDDIDKARTWTNIDSVIQNAKTLIATVKDLKDVKTYNIVKIEQTRMAISKASLIENLSKDVVKRVEKELKR